MGLLDLENFGPSKLVDDKGAARKAWDNLIEESKNCDPLPKDQPSLFVLSWQAKKQLMDEGIPANKIHILDSDEVL